jgi:hypothetical protein
VILGAEKAVRSRRRGGALVLSLLLAAVLLAGVLSYYASPSQDGLNRVAQDQGFSSLETQHGADGSPFAGYSTRGVEDERLSNGLAGVVGVAATFLLSGAIFLVVRRNRRA